MGHDKIFSMLQLDCGNYTLIVSNDELIQLYNDWDNYNKIPDKNKNFIFFPKKLKIGLESLSQSNEIFDLGKIPNCIDSIFFNFSFKTTNILGSFELLPSTIKNVKISKLYIPLDNLPNTIEHLEINQYASTVNIDNLPNGIKILILGDNFDLPINNILPNTLEKITLGKNFTQDINILPPNLIYISIENHRYNYTKINLLPEKIKIFKIYYRKSTFFSNDMYAKSPYIHFVKNLGKKIIHVEECFQKDTLYNKETYAWYLLFFE